MLTIIRNKLKKMQQNNALKGQLIKKIEVIIEVKLYIWIQINILKLLILYLLSE